jgi:hypothetical protein
MHQADAKKKLHLLRQSMDTYPTQLSEKKLKDYKENRKINTNNGRLQKDITT